MSLAQRSITSAAWNITTSALRVVVLLGRSILLARLLPVDTFGVYALAFSIITVSMIFGRLGTGGALVQRSSQTADLERATRVHFTLRLISASLWMAAVIIGALVASTDALRLALVSMAVFYGIIMLTDTPRHLLSRRVDHRRLAIMGLIEDILSTTVAVFLAWRGYTIVALLATDLVSALVQVVGLYVWRPVWRPRLLWDAMIARYMLNWGRKSVTIDLLGQGVDNIDELYIGAFLGNTPLGYYSRAFTFSTYPRRIIAAPIAIVAGGTYAELKYQRTALSRAFFRSTAMLARSGFAFAGLLVFLAPQIISILLGDKWLPMIPTFRLMLVFSLLDPLRFTIGGVFSAMGRLDQPLKTQWVQLLVLIAGIAVLGPLWDIEGVALAVDIMLVVGTILNLKYAREHVDFSPWRLFGPPTLALLIGAAAMYGIGALLCAAPALAPVCSSDWGVLISGGLLFSLGFGLTLLLLERNELLAAVRQILGVLLPKRRKAAVPTASVEQGDEPTHE